MNYGNLWNKYSEMYAADVLRKHGHILKWQNHNAHVLDVGCGDGVVTSKILYPYVKDYIQKLTAIDISKNHINYASEHNEIEKIDFQAMDIEDDKQTEKMKAKFENIFSFSTAHWVPDHKVFFGKLYEMLKPAGRIVVTQIARFSLHDSFRKQFKEGTWSKYLSKDNELPNYSDNPQEYIRKILGDVGFKVEEVCELEKKNPPIENYTDFIRGLICLYRYLDRIPSELREDYFQEHLKYCVQNSIYVREPDVYECQYETLTCIAYK